MKSATNWPSKADHSQNACAVLIVLAALCLAAVLLTGCGTVTPRQVTAAAASFDGGERNSGFIGWTTNGSGIITPHARERYNALIVDYGPRFHPPLVADYGLTATATNTFLITPEALADFAAMNRWRRNEAK